jgi:hypothetical protein
MKNLVFLAEVLQHVRNEEGDQPMTLQWLVRRIRMIIHSEIVQAPNYTILVRVLTLLPSSLVIIVKLGN